MVIAHYITFHLVLAKDFFICSQTDPWISLLDAAPPDIL